MAITLSRSACGMGVPIPPGQPHDPDPDAYYFNDHSLPMHRRVDALRGEPGDD
jgi:hypothetical protein